MDKPDKPAGKKGNPFSVNFQRHQQGHVQMDIAGPRSKVSYTGRPEGLRGVLGRMRGKNAEAPKGK